MNLKNRIISLAAAAAAALSSVPVLSFSAAGNGQ